MSKNPLAVHLRSHRLEVFLEDSLSSRYPRPLNRMLEMSNKKLIDAKLKDNLFSKEKASGRFEFNESVAQVFDDMLERSIPFYRECLEATVRLCSHLVWNNSTVYDLGCSTGALLEKLSVSLPENVRLVGIDNSEPMLKKARERLRERNSGRAVDFVNGDLNSDIELTDVSVVIMNYTLQFVPPENREKLLLRISNALSPGSALILIEKVKGEDGRLDKGFNDLHHQFKREQGYSNIEISRKKEALENVLVPLKERENLDMLRRAGFAGVDLFFRWFNFAGFVALKETDENSNVSSQTD